MNEEGSVSFPDALRSALQIWSRIISIGLTLMAVVAKCGLIVWAYTHPASPATPGPVAPQPAETAHWADQALAQHQRMMAEMRFRQWSAEVRDSRFGNSTDSR